MNYVWRLFLFRPSRGAFIPALVILMAELKWIGSVVELSNAMWGPKIHYGLAGPQVSIASRVPTHSLFFSRAMVGQGRSASFRRRLTLSRTRCSTTSKGGQVQTLINLKYTICG